MTDDKHAKRAARELAAARGISYTAARRQLGGALQPDGQEQEEPPPIVPTVGTPCPVDCDGSAHPRAVCWLWRPEDSKGVRNEVRRAAQLPNGRAEEIAWRYEPQGSFHGREARWLLALVYAMLTDQHPELRPGRARLWAAVETDDPDAVDAVMEPLDRAAARLLTKDPKRWWGEVHPLLDAYADSVENDDRELRTWQEVDDRHWIGRLVGKWRTAWTPVRNHNGYWDPPGVLWLAPKGWLDALLVERHGGHAPHARVRLADGRPAVVYAAQWGQDGLPTAYRVRELVPGTHGNIGRLVPTLKGNGEVVRAGTCRLLAPDEDDPSAAGVAGREQAGDVGDRLG
ncbi:hypothetical protein ABZ569_33395 [Streptomyces albus]|uniref:hypothetical protein n=1 Tax=Streptomyces albus TaxID=1888 RepID=UPI0033C427BC